jgi:hypothetical protein
MTSEFGESGFDEPMDIPDIPEPSIDSSDVPEYVDSPEYPEEIEIIEEPEEIEVAEESEAMEGIEEPEDTEVQEVAQEEIGEIDEIDEPQELSDIQQAVTAIGDIDAVDPGNWDSLGSEERLEALQSIEDHMAEIQGRPPVEVVADSTLGPGTYGGFDGDYIRINANDLSSDMPVDEFIDTTVHEGYHAYQDYAIKNPGVVEDTELVNAWAENQQNYLDAETYGQEIYQNQPLEANAWDYATQIRNQLIAENWSR